jgi:cold shock CspA family protein
MFKFKKDTQKERLELIASINASFTQLSKIKQKDSQAVHSIFAINQSLRLIQNDCMECQDQFLLQYIQKLIQECIHKDQQGLIHLYSEHIGSLIREEYVLNKHMTETETAKKEKLFQSKVLMVEQVTNAEKILKEMDDLTENMVSNNITKDSPRYLMNVSKFNSMQSQLNGYRESIQQIAEQMRREDMFTQVGIKEETLVRLKNSMTMTVSEFMSRIEFVKFEQEKFKAEGELIDAAFAELNGESTDYSQINDYDLQKHIEKNLLMKLKKEDSKNFNEAVQQFDGVALLNSIADLQKKHDELQNSIQLRFSNQKDELLKDIKRVLAEVYDENYLLKQTSGDLKQTVNHFMSMQPAEIQAASLKIRSTVENWFRYHLGHDLNHVIKFKNSKTVRDKMKSSGVDDAIIDQLEPIYRDANPYIHNNVEQISKKSDKERAREIEQAVSILTDGLIRFDQVDPIAGTLKLYVKEDQEMKSFLDQQIKDENDIEFVMKDVSNWLKNQTSRRSFLEKNNMELPHIMFLTQQDVLTYLSSAKQGLNTVATSVKEVPVKTELSKDADETTGKLISYNSEKGYGFIATKQENVFFHVTELRGVATEDLKTNLVLVFKLADGPKGKIATNIRIKNV